MTRYRNPRHELENQETEELEAREREQQEPARTVEEEVWKKRASDKDRYITQLKNEAKAREADLERKLDQALRGQIKPPKSDEEVAQWTKEYPEFASILETIVQKRITEATSTTEKKLEQISKREAELAQRDAVSQLKKLHPDLDKLSKDEDFHKWLSSRSEDEQNAIYRGIDVNRADLILTKYKAEKGKLSKVEDDEPAGSAAKVVARSRSAEPLDGHGDYDFTESQIETESKRNRRWFEQNEDAIMTAARKGRILYDVTGGAR